MKMAANVSQALWKLGYLHRPCHFAVTTRHSSKKMSWHITLNALASHDTWRKALTEMEAAADTPLGSMYAYVDKTTKNNSKSQYMQARGSTKVAPGVKGDGNFFKDVGLFYGDKAVEIPGHRYSLLFYAATSVMVHDPWSLPFKCKASSVQEPLTTKKKRPPNAEPIVFKEIKRSKTPADVAQDAGLAIVAITHWGLVPEHESAWMRKLVERSDGSTRLLSIPSMSNPQYWCW